MDAAKYAVTLDRLMETKDEIILAAESNVHDAFKRIVELTKSKDDRVALDASIFIVEKITGQASQSINNLNQEIFPDPVTPPLTMADYLDEYCDEGGTAH